MRGFLVGGHLVQHVGHVEPALAGGQFLGRQPPRLDVGDQAVEPPQPAIERAQQGEGGTGEPDGTT
jgi:hypothetical protein